jgi:hypothetical protein
VLANRESAGRKRRQSLSSFLLIGSALMAGAPFASADDNPPPPPQQPVNYNKPAREYETAAAGDWTVLLEKQLSSEAPDVAKKALARLKEKLPEAMKALPASSHATLKKLKFFLMYGPKAKGGGRDNGLEYFQKNAPEHHDDLDRRWGGNVVVYCAENYTQISDFWALKALVHEMAHAYHLSQWPEDQKDIYDAWKNAMDQGLYHGVKDDQGMTLDKVYAATNQLEYFAELSCMYFVGCNYQPFNRKELKEYDPTGYAMIEKMWRVKPEKPDARPKDEPKNKQ